MKLFIMQSPPVPDFFLALISKYSPQNPQSMFFLSLSYKGAVLHFSKTVTVTVSHWTACDAPGCSHASTVLKCFTQFWRNISCSVCITCATAVTRVESIQPYNVMAVMVTCPLPVHGSIKLYGLNSSVP